MSQAAAENLHHAIAFGHELVVRHALLRGADPQEETVDGESALMLAFNCIRLGGAPEGEGRGARMQIARALLNDWLARAPHRAEECLLTAMISVANIPDAEWADGSLDAWHGRVVADLLRVGANPAAPVDFGRSAIEHARERAGLAAFSGKTLAARAISASCAQAQAHLCALEAEAIQRALGAAAPLAPPCAGRPAAGEASAPPPRAGAQPHAKPRARGRPRI